MHGHWLSVGQALGLRRPPRPPAPVRPRFSNSPEMKPAIVTQKPLLGISPDFRDQLSAPHVALQHKVFCIDKLHKLKNFLD
jgi:hypothetical protein